MMYPVHSRNAHINIALIGCGRIAQSHLQAISEIPECRLQGVVDVREDAARSVADQYGSKAFTDYRRLVDETELDAVVICTPPNTHPEVGAFFLQQGTHVLCEKPLAVNSHEAGDLVQMAEDKSCLLMMASKFRYVDDVVKAKGIVESGILGDVMLFENVFCSKVDMRGRWNSRKEISGGGVLIDNGCHSVDIARFLLGPIQRVQAEEGRRVQKCEVEDTARLYFRTQSDAMGAVDLSWSIHKERESYIDLFGTEGVLSIGWKCSKYRQNEAANWISFGKGYDKSSAFRKQLKNFVDSLAGTAIPLITAKDSLESVKVIESAYKSVNVNKWIDVS